MDKRLRLSISFKRKYKHVYEHLQKQGNGNRSDYIAKLVERDLQSGKESSLQDNLRTIVHELIQSHKFISNVPKPNTEIISEEDADLINQLF